MDATTATGQPRLLISSAALRHNLRMIRQRLAPATRVCAVIKADAYGHGAAIVGDALCRQAVDGRDPKPPDAAAVACLDEAIELVEAIGAARPVLLLRPVENAFLGQQRAAIHEAIHRRCTLTVCSITAAEDIARLAQTAEKPARVQVMIDTGMGREGASLDELDALLDRITGLPLLQLRGLCTHFARGEEANSTGTSEQLARFRAATDARAQSRSKPILRHAANSGAIWAAPGSHLDMVRPGVALYGIDPIGRPSPDRPFQPVMKWVAPLIGVRALGVGASVGYSHTWTAHRPSQVGLVPVGYADGYPRCLGGRAQVIVAGRPAPVIGRVSMDLITIDLTDHPSVALGDDVVLLDDDPHSPASVYELARWADTIPYEIVCRIGKRIKRVAVEAGYAEAQAGPHAAPPSRQPPLPGMADGCRGQEIGGEGCYA